MPPNRTAQQEMEVIPRERDAALQRRKRLFIDLWLMNHPRVVARNQKAANNLAWQAWRKQHTLERLHLAAQRGHPMPPGWAPPLGNWPELERVRSLARAHYMVD